jgi:hypothetical protein
MAGGGHFGIIPFVLPAGFIAAGPSGRARHSMAAFRHPFSGVVARNIGKRVRLSAARKFAT